MKMFFSGTMKIPLEILRNEIFGLAISGHLPFKYYVREGLLEKYQKLQKNISK